MIAMYKQWIEDGLTIRKHDDEYLVFTVPTQHFTVRSLDELTPNRFRLEEDLHKRRLAIRDLGINNWDIHRSLYRAIRDQQEIINEFHGTK